ncbi:hypothetical protein BC829DRAFT_421159 [Chytridium lagenaria]|nr:hypothetical protein BC829DRAFT_421159 [Chytridium lagenaria]
MYEDRCSCRWEKFRGWILGKAKKGNNVKIDTLEGEAICCISCIREDFKWETVESKNTIKTKSADGVQEDAIPLPKHLQGFEETSKIESRDALAYFAEADSVTGKNAYREEFVGNVEEWMVEEEVGKVGGGRRGWRCQTIQLFTIFYGYGTSQQGYRVQSSQQQGLQGAWSCSINWKTGTSSNSPNPPSLYSILVNHVKLLWTVLKGFGVYFGDEEGDGGMETLKMAYKVRNNARTIKSCKLMIDWDSKANLVCLPATFTLSINPSFPVVPTPHRHNYFVHDPVDVGRYLHQPLNKSVLLQERRAIITETPKRHPARSSKQKENVIKLRGRMNDPSQMDQTHPPSTAAHEPRSAHTLPFGQPPASDNLHLPLDTSFDLGESVSAMPRYQPPQLDDEEEEEDHEEEEGGMTMPQAAATAQEEENVLMERDWSSFVYIVPPAPTAGMQGMKTLERISAMLRRKEEELLLERSLQIDVDETTFERKIKIQEQQQREQEIQRNEREQISKDPAAARANAINLILERRNRRGEENVAAQMENSDAVAQAPSARPNIFATLARRLNADSGAPPAAQIDISTTDTPVSPDASAWEPVTSTESGDSYIEPSSVPGFSTAPRPSFSSTDSSVASRNETVHGTTRSSKTLPRLGSVSRTDDGVDASANRARTLPRLHMSSTVMPSADLVDVPSRGSSLATTAAPIPQVDVNAMLQQLQKQQIMQQAQGYNEGENYLNLKYMMLTGQGPSSAPSAAIADWVASVAAANPGSTTSSMAAIDTMLSPTDAGKTTNLPISTPKTPHGLTPTQRSMLAGSPVTFSPRSSSRNLKDGPPSPIQSPLLPRSATQQQASSPLIPARHIQNYNQHHHFIAHPPPSTPIQSANSPVPNQPSTLSSLLHQHSPTNSPPHIHPGSSKTLPHPTSKSILNSALNFINRAPGSNSGFQTLLPSFATRARAPRTTTTAAVLDAARRKQEVEERGRKREKGEIHRRSTSASALESSLGHPARVLRRSSVESIRGWVEKEVGIENDVDKMLPTPPPVSASAYSNAPLSITIDSSISHKANPSATSFQITHRHLFIYQLPPHPTPPPFNLKITTLFPQKASSSSKIHQPRRCNCSRNSTTPPTLSSPTSSHKRWNSDDVGAWKPDTSPMTLGRIPQRALHQITIQNLLQRRWGGSHLHDVGAIVASQNSAMGWMPPSPKPKSTLAPQPISESRPATGRGHHRCLHHNISKNGSRTLQTRPTAASTRRPQKQLLNVSPRVQRILHSVKTGNRTFLKHGQLGKLYHNTVKTGTFLFSDILIMAKETTDSHYEIKGFLT